MLDRADVVLASDAGSDAEAAAQLDTLAATLAEQLTDRSGTTRERYLALTDIMEDLAGRLR